MATETTAAMIEDDAAPAAAQQDEDDVVEGASDAPDDGVITVGVAASEYFKWADEREEQRVNRAAKRNQLRASRSAARKAQPAFGKEQRMAVTRFVSHVTPYLPIRELTPHGMTAFQEAIGANATREDKEKRLRPVKDFLRFCWKPRGYTESNLGNHLRIKSVSVRSTAGAPVEHEEAERFEMTAEGLEQLKEDLERLQQDMPAAIQAVAEAREDKDIRENAPLEAAREYQERLKSRIDEVEYQIAHAVVSESKETGRAHLGSTVRVCRLDTEEERIEEYTLVGPTEVDAPQRRISVESPVGKGLVDAAVGAIVEIEVPRGTMRYRVDAVEG